MAFYSALIALVIFVSSAFAAIPVRQAGTEKHNIYMDHGVFVGGHEHGVLTLFDIRRSMQAKVERVVLDVGQKSEKNNSERPGFFHIALQDKPRRIVIDLESVDSSRLDERQIGKLFLNSPYVSKVNFFEDFFHKNVTLELNLKKATEIEVFELMTPGKPGRIVMDIKNL